MEKENSIEINSLVSEFISDYISNADNSGNIEQWVADKMQSEIPNMDISEAADIAAKITATINSINNNIQSINNAAENGVTRESWFIKNFDKTTADKSAGEKGKILTGLANGLCNAVKAFNGETEIYDELTEADEAWDDSKWNEYSLSDIALKVVQQAGAASLKALEANLDEAAEQEIESGISADVISPIGSAMDVGIKVAAAGALNTAYKKGMFEDFLPEDISTQSLSNIAVGAVENVRVFAQAAQGEISVEEAVDKTQRNTIARMVDFLADNSDKIGGFVGSIFGPKGAEIGKKVGKVVKYLATTEVRDFITEGANKVCSFARSCVQTVAEKAVSIFEGIKNFIFS